MKASSVLLVLLVLSGCGGCCCGGAVKQCDPAIVPTPDTVVVPAGKHKRVIDPGYEFIVPEDGSK
jgi:hypothetical protein